MKATTNLLEEAHNTAVDLKATLSGAAAMEADAERREDIEEVLTLATLATRLLFEIRFGD